MPKVTVRIDDKTLQQIDAKVDHIWVKNRSQAMIRLLKKSLGKEKTAVILARGPNLFHKDFEKNIKVGKDWNSTVKIGSTTLIEEQVKRLRRYGFTIIYILTLKGALDDIQKRFRDQTDITLHYVPLDLHMRSNASLKLLKKKITGSFLIVFADILFDVNLQSLYERHMENDAVCTLTVMTHPTPQVKGSVKVDGTHVIEFEEKNDKPQGFIVFEPIFMASPQLFDIEGDSVVFDVFPRLAGQRLLQAHFSTGRIAHLHEEEDIEKLKFLL